MTDPTRFVPDGSCTLSKRREAFPSGVWRPAFGGSGPYVLSSLTDRPAKYLDLVCALGALTVGHNHPHVVEAVCQQMRAGAIFSLPHVLEGHVAERLCSVIPCAEQVKFVKTGSESTAAAIRIARAATGRSEVWGLKGHYHGWHDWWAQTSEKHPGVEEDGQVFAFEDLAALLLAAEPQRLADASAYRPAAIIVEPERLEMADGGGLQLLVDTARRIGTVVIFDEMLSGGRLRVGGAQELYGVEPDLACFGKAFGGGLPLAFVCGRRELMQHAWPVSGTFSGDALALAACDAMLDLYEREDVIGKLWSVGTALYQSIAYFGHGHPRLGLRLHGRPPRFWLTFGAHVDRRQFMSVVVQQAAQRGVLMHQAVIFASAAMDPEQTKTALTAVTIGLEAATAGGPLVGEPYKDSAR